MQGTILVCDNDGNGDEPIYTMMVMPTTEIMDYDDDDDSDDSSDDTDHDNNDGAAIILQL